MGNLQIIAVLVKNIELSCLFITFNVGFAYKVKRKKRTLLTLIAMQGYQKNSEDKTVHHQT